MALLGWGGSPKDKITYNKGTLAYPSSVIAAKLPLVGGGSHHGSILHLVKHVDVRLVLLLGLLLVVEMNVGRVKVEVRGDDCLSPLDKEEGGVTG